MQRVLVMGASGNTGRVLLEELRRNGLNPVAALRAGLATQGIPADCECRVFQYGNEERAAAVLTGIDGLFLLVPFHEEMVAWGEQLVSQAKQRGVNFIVRLSGLGASPVCASKMGVLHAQIDRAVEESGIDHCILRCNSFMQNFSGIYRDMIQRHGVISLPEGDARSCFIDTADIAAVAARIFSEPQKHVGQVYDLGGPEPLSNAEVAAIISQVTGAAVRYRAATDEEAERAYRRLGISPWRIEVLMSLSRFIRQGNAGRVTTTVASILGRPPHDFRRFASLHRQHWQ